MNLDTTGNPTIDDPIEDPVAEALAGDEAESKRMDAVYRKARVARDKLNQVVDELGVKADHLDKAMRQNLDRTEGKIKDNPFAAVGIAAGVGLLIGLLLNRRH